MKVKVQLNKKGPPMWFLGEPRKIILSLNFTNPGPKIIEFKELEPCLRTKLMDDIQRGLIDANVDYAVLFKEHNSLNRPQDIALPKLPPVQNSQPTKIIDRVTFDEAMRKAEICEDKLSQKCMFILKNGIQGVKAALSTEVDLKCLRKLAVLERTGKKRKGVLNLLKEKIKFLTIQEHKLITQKIKEEEKVREMNRQIKQSGLSKETYNFSVIESDERVVILSPEDLINGAAQKSS